MPSRVVSVERAFYLDEDRSVPVCWFVAVDPVTRLCKTLDAVVIETGEPLSPDEKAAMLEDSAWAMDLHEEALWTLVRQDRERDIERAQRRAAWTALLLGPSEDYP